MPPTDDRDETRDERLDRNWDELLQELRITQTGLQLLSGFLLTLAFTDIFGGLDRVQKGLYLCLVLLGALAVGANMMPVMLHRRVFGRHVKERVVQLGHVVSQLVIVAVAVLFTGTATLIFSVVAGWTAAVVVACCLVVALGVMLGLVPGRLARASRRGDPDR
jgi:Family of unknown function (DUF6328)